MRRMTLITHCSTGGQSSDAIRLIHGPNVSLCLDCIAAARRRLTGQRRADWVLEERRCSFCSRQIRVASRPEGGPAICGDCVRLCEEVIRA